MCKIVIVFDMCSHSYMQMHVFVIIEWGRCIHLQVFLTCVEVNTKLENLNEGIKQEHTDWNLMKWHATAFIAVTT
jgi:hypothetical protein